MSNHHHDPDDLSARDYHASLTRRIAELKRDLDDANHVLDQLDIKITEALEAIGQCPGKPAGMPDRIDAAAKVIRSVAELERAGESSDRIEALFWEVVRDRDHLARLVDSGDLDGAREVARAILEGASDVSN